MAEKRTEFQASSSLASGLTKSEFRALVHQKLPRVLVHVGLLTSTKLPVLEERGADNEVCVGNSWASRGSSL